MVERLLFFFCLLSKFRRESTTQAYLGLQVKRMKAKAPLLKTMILGAILALQEGFSKFAPLFKSIPLVTSAKWEGSCSFPFKLKENAVIPADTLWNF